ncbi:MAG: hypothetical protein EZS28_009067, partial [Streblomastix strix]
MSDDQKKIKGIAEIVRVIIQLYDSKKEIDQYAIAARICGKYHIQTPKFTEIMLSIPDNYKEKIIPLLKVKPIRTASG